MKWEDGEIGLRPYAPSDREQLARLADNYNVARYLSILPNPYTLEEADAWIARVSQEKENMRCNFAIARDGDFVGTCGIVPGSGVHAGTAEIGYWVGEPYWGQGIAARPSPCSANTP